MQFAQFFTDYVNNGANFERCGFVFAEFCRVELAMERWKRDLGLKDFGNVVYV